MTIANGSDVVVAYGDHVAIAQSSFSVARGEITAVIGPNGSGKSTLLGTLAGLIKPADGSIEITPIDGKPARISYVLQSTKVNEALPISVREVVTMGRYTGHGLLGRLGKDDRTAVQNAMERLDITRIADRPLHELSGGQRQRVFVAQGLAQDHDILLLDEPLTGIDLTAAKAIDRVIHDETARGCTVVMTTHDLSEAQAADNVILMSGRVVACGRPDDVITPDNLSAAYGPSLIHAGHRGALMVDDPGHQPVDGRHIHRERSIHTEPSRTDVHGEEI